jgi:tRNA U34 5-methylaminomethyl-2-thiouridine-forming methyltransferase MnmC
MPDYNDQENKTFKGDLGDYHIIETEDGSITLHSEAFNETCHSVSGAVEETLYNYVEGCEIAEKLQHADLELLEVGFGLGTGFKTTVEHLSQQNILHKLTFISTELDAKLVKFAKENNPLSTDLPYPDLSSLEFRTEPVKHFTSEKNGHKLIILLGNARETVPKAFSAKLFSSLGAIYQDPFSPKRNPILWTTEWFQDLAKCSNNTAIMSTYSSSNSIRKAMIAAGWKVRNRKGFGTKRTATRAFLHGESEEDVLLQLERSPVKALSDNNFKDSKNA